MEFIGLIIISIWGLYKLLGGSSNKDSFTSIEKYKTFESFRKK